MIALDRSTSLLMVAKTLEHDALLSLHEVVIIDRDGRPPIMPSLPFLSKHMSSSRGSTFSLVICSNGAHHLQGQHAHRSWIEMKRTAARPRTRRRNRPYLVGARKGRGRETFLRDHVRSGGGGTAATPCPIRSSASSRTWQRRWTRWVDRLTFWANNKGHSAQWKRTL